MNLFYIAKKSTKKNIKKYISYLISNILIFTLICSFNTVIFSENMNDLLTLFDSTSYKDFYYVIIIFSLIIAIIQGWFIFYMNSYMLKNRSKEISIYMTLGINRKDIKSILLLENILLLPLVVVSGIIFGFFLSSFIWNKLLYFFDASNSLIISFYKTSTICTSYYLISIFCSHFILSKKLNKVTINFLLNDFERSENKTSGTKNKNKSNIFYAIISLFLLLFSIYMFNIPTNNITIIFLAIPLLLVFTILFFINILPILLLRISDKDFCKYSYQKLFIVKLISFRMKQTKRIIGVVSGLLIASIVCIGIAGSFFIKSENIINDDIYDFFIINKSKDKIEYINNYKILKKYKTEGEIFQYYIYESKSSVFNDLRNNELDKFLKKNNGSISASDLSYKEFKFDSYMKIRDYNKIREKLGYNKIKLKGDEIVIHCLPYLKQIFIDNKDSFGSYSLNGINTERFSQFKNYVHGQDFIVVVSDEMSSKLNKKYLISGIILKNGKNRINFESLNNIKKISYSMGIDTDDGLTLLKGNDKMYAGGKLVKKSYNNLFILIFPLFFMGLILFIVGVAIITFEFVNQLRLYIRNYKKLELLGINRRQIKNIAKRHVGVYFLIIGIVTSIFSALSIFVFSKTYWIKSYEIPIVNIQLNSFIFTFELILLYSVILGIVWLFSYIYIIKNVNKE